MFCGCKVPAKRPFPQVSGIFCMILWRMTKRRVIKCINVTNGIVRTTFISNFANCMSHGQKETITTRIISTVFTVLALAIFKPFGLEAWQWMGYIHLLVIGMLGFGCCMVTEAILIFIVQKPRSYDHGVDYIIKRNLWFQLINTPLVSL